MSQKKFDSISSASATTPSQSLLSRAFSRNEVWDDKKDLFDVIYWARQAIAIAVAILFAVAGDLVLGLAGHVLYVLLSSVLLFFYYSKYLGVEEEEFGRWELLSEGFASSYALFMVIWIAAHTATLEALS